MEERLLTLLQKVLGEGKKTSKTNYAFTSPFENHRKPKLEIDIQLNSKGINKWHCWISDEKGTSIKSLFKKIKVDKSIWDEHNSIFSKKYKYVSTDIFGNTLKDDEFKVSLVLPSEYIPLWKLSNSIIRKHAIAYLHGRGISNLEIIKYQIGYCESGIYKHKLIIPSYDSDGKLNYFVGRSFYDTEVTYKNPNVSKDIIGFEMMVNWDLPIKLCEGVFDAIAIKFNAIPLFGKSIQSELLKRIIQNKSKSVYIILDDDAFKNALKFSEKLMNEGVSVHLVKLKGDDPSKMGYKLINNIIENTPPLTLSKLMEYKLLNI